MYLPSNSAAISLTNFGARGDGVFDNRGAILAAFSGLYASNGGTLIIPKGTFYFSGTVDLTGRDISLVGEQGSVLLAALDESAKKINISGAERIYIDSLTFNSNRTGVTNVNNQLGFLNLINSRAVFISNNEFFNTKNSSIYLGGGVSGVNVQNNYFTGTFCGVFGYLNSGERENRAFNISNNIFDRAWMTTQMNESAAIKIQVAQTSPNFSYGHTIDGNTINGSYQMGIELWSKVRDSVVCNNAITNTTWGISLDNCENMSVVGNSVRGVGGWGIECATACKNITIANNVVNGFAVTGNNVRITPTAYSATNTSSQNIIYNGNVAIGASTYGFHLQNTNNVILNANIIEACNISLNIQRASKIYAHGNVFQTGYGLTTAYHVFFDAVDQNLTGFHFADNIFRGCTTDQSVFYYNNFNSNRVRDVCFENNTTDETTRAATEGFIAGQFTPVNYIYRNNFGPLSGTVFNTILDASDSSSPYKSTDIHNGFTYYGSQTYTIPTGGLTGNAAWLCIWSGGGGDVRGYRGRILKTPDGLNNTATNAEIFATFSPYGSDLTHTLVASPQSSYNGTNINQIRTDAHPTTATNSVWAKFNIISSGSNPIYLNYSLQNNLTQPFLTYTEPVWNPRSAVVYTTNNLEHEKSFWGYSIQSGSFIAGLTGVRGAKVDIQANEPGLDLARFRKSNGDVAFQLNQSGRVYSSGSSGDYAMIVQSFQGVTGARGLKVSAGETAGDDAILVTNAVGTVLVRIDGVGKLGIGTSTPQQALDVVGNGVISGTLVVTGIITASTGLNVTTGNITVGSGAATSAGIISGYLGISGYGALWSTSVTPSSSNYALATNGTSSFLRGSTEVYLTAGATNICWITSTGLSVTGTLASSGGFGCNGNAAQGKYASGGLLAGVVAALVANGILSN